ncbi:MAG: response regulator [Candidatus Gracilibacteria bacterium]|nr:response regulator [Candidatus Gracilibacteria bacterium]
MIYKILIVEDDKDLSTMYKIKFEKEGFEVLIADNGLDAVTLLTEFKPNVILLDIMMPSMDGFETLRVIRNLAPSLSMKIIMFSNLDSKEDINKCMKLGADAYLLKANTTPKDAVLKALELIESTKILMDGFKIESEIRDAIKVCPHCLNEINIDLKLYK